MVEASCVATASPTRACWPRCGRCRVTASCPRSSRLRPTTTGRFPIGFGQTISQPYIVAFMTEALALSPSDVVLEIGTGSGYQAAVLAEIAREVYTIEIVPELAERARARLTRQGYRHVHVRAGDGYRGWPEHAPFPKIIVTAAPEEVPQALIDQLAIGGTMVLPVGPQWGQQELRISPRPNAASSPSAACRCDSCRWSSRRRRDKRRARHGSAGRPGMRRREAMVESSQDVAPSAEASMEGVFRAWGRILAGYRPNLSIEITRECPLHCPGCYAYGSEHLGGGVTLRDVRDLHGQALVDGVLALVDRLKPVHLSIVGGEPLVRRRELETLLPTLSGRGIYTQLVTSAVAPIPAAWAALPRLQIACRSTDCRPSTTCGAPRPRMTAS